MFKKIIIFIKKIYQVTTNFEKKIELNSRSNSLLVSALTSNTRLVTDEMLGQKELIVSFTTYNKRIHDVHLVIESIGLQTLKPNKLILWLDEDEFSLDTIPFILKNQMGRGLEIRFCPNYRSYKKLIPTLKLFPKSNIVTIDDDILYPYDMLELLYKEHILFPNTVLGHCARYINVNDSGKVMPYRSWKHEFEGDVASINTIAIGMGGVFYPADTLPSECLNISAFTELAPNADDIWFKAMALINNVKHKKVKDDRNFATRFLVIESSQDIALANENLVNSRNDSQVSLVFERYGLVKKLKS